MKPGVYVEGIKPILRRLKRLPERNRRHAVKPAVRKASTPVVKTAKRLAPKGETTPQNRKPLKKTIKKTGVKWNKRTDTMYAVVGPAAREAPHSHLVHDGTKPHQIVLGKLLMISSTTSLGRGASGRFETVTQTAVLPAGFVINHPGAKATPFIDRAVDAERTNVQRIIAREIPAGIEKQVQKLAKK